MDDILQTTRLTKSYHGKTVVDSVNMRLHKGEIYGFVGPNGAGKSTIMKMLFNLVKPDSGSIQIFGKNLSNTSFDILRRMGSIIENPYFYEKLSGKENLQLHCSYMGYPNTEKIDCTLETVGLKDAGEKAVANYSLGMKQRLAIGRAILTKPELLILDEPINALDPEGIKEMRLLFRTLNDEHGITILISSHILSEVEQIAHRIGIISHGKLLKEISMDEIHEYQTDCIETEVTNIEKAGYPLTEKLNISNFKILNPNLIRIYDTLHPGEEIINTFVYNGVGVQSLIRRHSTLEDYFFEITEGGTKHA